MDSHSILLNTISASHYVIIGLCLLASAFFSGIEIAFLSANKLRIELQSKQNNLRARILSIYQKKPSTFISTVLVANNFALVIYGIYMGELLESGLQMSQNTLLSFLYSNTFIKFLLVTIISTLIVLVTAEFIPKSLFRLNPDFLLNLFIVPFRFFEILLFPVVWFVKTSGNGLLKLFLKEPLQENKQVFSTVDLDDFIATLEKSGTNSSSEFDTQILRNALDFSEIRVRDFMVPRLEIVALNIEENIETLARLFADTAHSKIMIYRNNIDNIVGFVHHNELFQKPKEIKEVLKPIFIVNDSMQAHDLLREFMQKRKSIAIVVDEFGGTAGMCTMEDVIEEIFGEIEDEFDEPELTETVVKANHFIFSCRLEIDYLNNKYNLNIPQGDYTTLGGFITQHTERIPRAKETIQIVPFEILVTKAKGSHMEEVEFKII